MPPHLVELHIRECGLESPLISESKQIIENKAPLPIQLQILRISSCQLNDFEVRELSELTTLELYDCSIGASGIKISGCSKLEKIVLFKCTELNDAKLLNMLRPLLKEEQQSDVEEPGEESEKPATNDDDSIFDIASRGNRKTGPLKKLFLTECEPLSNPVIQSNSLEEIKIIDCKFISKPFISCPSLTKLQLNWCENLKSLNLACDNLQCIDLTGAGVTYSSSQSNSQGTATRKDENVVIQQVIAGLKKHYGDQITITV